MIQGNLIQLTFLAEYRFLALLSQAIMTVAEMLRDDGVIDEAELLAGDVYLAAHEVCTNIIDHAYAVDQNQTISVEIAVDHSLNELKVLLEDNGRSFDPDTLTWPPPESWQTKQNCHGVYYQLEMVPEPSIEQERGRGLFLLTQLLEEITYHPRKGRNCWQLRKRF